MKVLITYTTNELDPFKPYLNEVIIKGFNIKAILGKFIEEYKDCRILDYERVK